MLGQLDADNEITLLTLGGGHSYLSQVSGSVLLLAHVKIIFPHLLKLGMATTPSCSHLSMVQL